MPCQCASDAQEQQQPEGVQLTARRSSIALYLSLMNSSGSILLIGTYIPKNIPIRNSVPASSQALLSSRSIIAYIPSRPQRSTTCTPSRHYFLAERSFSPVAPAGNVDAVRLVTGVVIVPTATASAALPSSRHMRRQLTNLELQERPAGCRPARLHDWRSRRSCWGSGWTKSFGQQVGGLADQDM